jgi:hypothetical protein
MNSNLQREICGIGSFSELELSRDVQRFVLFVAFEEA